MDLRENTGEGEKRRIVLVICLSVFISLVGIGIVVPLFAVFAEDLGASAFWIGAVFSSFAVSRTIFMPYFGRLSDRTEKKMIIASGLLAYTFVSFAYIAVESIEGLVMVRFMHGIASAAIAPVAMAYIGEIAGRGEEGALMSRYQASIFFGFGAGPVIGGAVYSAFGYDAAFSCLALFSAFALGVIVVFLPRSKSDAERKSAPESETGVQNFRMKALLSVNRTIAGVFLLTLFLETGFTCLFAFLPLYVAIIGFGSFVSGAMISANVFLSGFLQVFFGKIADSRNRAILIPTGSAVFGFSLVAVIFSGSIIVLFVIMLVNAAGSMFILPAVNAYLVEAGRKTGMGTMMGAYNTVRGAGNIIAPLAGGLVIDAAGINSMFFIAGILVVSGGAAFFLVQRTDKTASK